MMSLRRNVLRCFRELHRTRKSVFEGDSEALQAARLKINEEFRKNKNVQDQSQINELIKVAEDSSLYLKKMVVQATYNENRDIYEVQLTPESHLEENFPFLGGNNAPKRSKSRRTTNNKTGSCDKAGS